MFPFQMWDIDREGFVIVVGLTKTLLGLADTASKGLSARTNQYNQNQENV